LSLLRNDLDAKLRRVRSWVAVMLAMSVSASVSWATSHHFLFCGLRNGKDNE